MAEDTLYDSSEEITISSDIVNEYGITSIQVRAQQPFSSEDIPLVAEYGGATSYDEPNVIEPFPLYVGPEKFRGRGIGEALVRRLVEDAIRQGVDMMRGEIESQYALDIRARIFGKIGMKFFLNTNESRNTGYYAELPITFDQARGSLVRAEAHEKSLEDRRIGFVVEQYI